MRVLAAAVLFVTACTPSGAGRTAAPVPPRAQRSVASPAPVDWPTYHGNAARTGAGIMPSYTGHLTVAHRLTLDGAVYASPIVVGGRIVAATESDTVYAFSTAGALVWKRHLGTPAPQAQLPCGNVFPLGITGTPVSSYGLVYVVAEYGGPPRHELVALRLTDGTVAWQRSVDLPGVDAAAMQQRGALTVDGGRIWAPFGGLAGDCGAYKGRLVGIPGSGRGATAVYTVPTAREGGMWTPPGPSVDAGHYLYQAVGNGAAGPGDPYDHSDSVLKLSSTGGLVDFFAPTSWATDNAGDLDLGSQGPALVGKWVFIAGKSGRAYVLDRAHLGHIGGQVSSRVVCPSYGGTAVLGATVFVPCQDGVRAVRISATGTMSVAWHAPVAGSPVTGAGVLWAVDPAGVLWGFSPVSGAPRVHIGVGRTSRFATPALYGNLLVVPTLTGLTIVRES